MADKSINQLPVSDGLTDDALLVVYQNDKTQSIKGELIKQFAGAVQADWNETDESSAAFIKNKPSSLPSGSSNEIYVGSGPVPEGTKIWINPNGAVITAAEGVSF